AACALNSPRVPAFALLRSRHRGAVLLVVHFFHPLHCRTVADLGDSEVCHRLARRATMPVFDASRAAYHVPGTDLFNLLTPYLNAAGAARHDEDLTGGMRM